LLSLAFLSPTISPAQQIAIGGYALPFPLLGPQDIAVGPDGALWFTGWDDSAIGRITTAGAITAYSLPTAFSYPMGITAGPDGALWFAETGGVIDVPKIGRITTAGAITEFPLPSGSDAFDITTGPDGALWFTEQISNKIGRITTAGALTEYPLLPDAHPTGIVTGPDGALWFAQEFGSIGRLTTEGSLTEYPVPTPNIEIYSIAVGPDQALWFTEYTAGKIGRITTAGTITEYPVPNERPYGIAAGPDGALWFTDVTTKIGKITTAGAVTLYHVPARFTLNEPSAPDQITTGPDGELWFTENGTSRIGEVVFTTATLSVTPASGYFQSSLTFTGSGFAANESVHIYTSGVGSAVLASATADSSGSFTAAAPAPQSVLGPRIFLGVGESSGLLAAASFSMTPRLILSPDAGPVGGRVTATGYGFGSRDMVNVFWDSPRTLLGTVQAGVNGTFEGSAAVTFTLPAGAAYGKNAVFAKGEFGGFGPGSFWVQ